MRLPGRLAALLELVPEVGSVADIGSGHGALALALAARGMRVVATERTVVAFDHLRADLDRHRLPVEARRGDGLAPLAPGEVDLVVVAGMGGRSIIPIVEAATWLPRWLILQPVQDAGLVARWLGLRGWRAREVTVEQRRRGYRAWLVEVPAAERGLAA